MANKLSIRFYTVEKLNPNGFSLRQALQLIDRALHPQREREVVAGFSVRLERYSNDAGELAGEFTRVRTTNFPFEVRDNGVRRLRTNGPLGDGVAFRFRRADHTLAMQYDNRIVSPRRAMDYLMAFDARAAFKITPKMDSENWRKFRTNPLRKLRVAVASPDHLADIEDPAAPVVQSFRELGDAYDAPMIVLEIGMGHRQGELSEAAKGLAEAMFSRFVSHGADLRSLKARVESDDGGRTDEVNLIDEILSDKTELDLPRNDPERSYQIRRDFLRQRLREHGN